MATGKSAEEYDIIIIGGGTAGCVLANRLSEDPDVSVLVVEAGEDRSTDERISIPYHGATTHGNPDYDWACVTEPQQGINGRQIRHPRGKLLGGSSAINSLALTYPSAAGLDVWADLGNDGWGWDGLKNYYRKFQTVCTASERVRSGLDIIESGKGTNGPIQATYPVSVIESQRAWTETFAALGLQNTSDPLEGAALGGYISTNHVSDDLHERSHAGVAFYGPAKARLNVSLVTGAMVQRITFEKCSGRDLTATGIEYFKDGKAFHALARKEVILSAGVFGSPQILELSGIGDTKILQKIGIETLYNNPNVGENLQDHLRTGFSFEANDDDARKPVVEEEASKLYKEHRTGPWVDRSSVPTFAYLPLDQFLEPTDKQHLIKLLDEHLDSPSLSKFEKIRDAFIKEMTLSPSEATTTAFMARKSAIPDPEQRNWITIFAMLSHTFSRGSCHIVSSNPAAKPIIDPQYYSNPLDLEIHARHLQSLTRIASTPPLSNYAKTGGACLPINKRSLLLDEAKQIVREHAMTNYHPCGTCSMMPEEMGGVVDSSLRVYGTRNVRVVDASIMPVIPRCNIITTVYASAEKAADIISRDLGIKRTT